MGARKLIDPDELLEKTARLLDDNLRRLAAAMRGTKGFDTKLAVGAKTLAASVAKLHGEMRQAGKANKAWALKATLEDRVQLILDIFEDLPLERQNEVRAAVKPI